MKKTMSTAPLVAAVCLLWSAAAVAKVPASEAERLGKDLTCTGAEKAGSASGVPEFTGKWLGVPPGVKWTPSSGQHPVDIYADEKPLYVITAENMNQYADRLSDGQKAMFAKYPKTFRIPVYPGHRDFRFPDDICAVIKKNALEAEVIDNGLGVKSYKGGIAFPFPKTGDELTWNNLMPMRAYTEKVLRDNANVRSDGGITWGRQLNQNLDMFSDPANRGKPVTREDLMAYSLAHTLLPERDKGNVSTSQEPMNFAHNKRMTWAYDPGTRRVRQVPEYGFDQPMGGTSGKLTIDSDRLFNGSPERYTWKSLGKREMYIPANAFKIHTKNVKYADLLTPGHANPEFMRYELRRVWVLEGTVKQGYRHMYGKRVLFLDEDTHQAITSDYYDARGQLWQHALINYYYDYDIRAFHAGTSFYHDLISGGYLAYNLFQERPIGPILNKGDLKPADYTPEAARNLGT